MIIMYVGRTDTDLCLGLVREAPPLAVVRASVSVVRSCHDRTSNGADDCPTNDVATGNGHAQKTDNAPNGQIVTVA